MAALQGKLIFPTSLLVISSLLCVAATATEPGVVTDPEVTLRKGYQGLLPCKVGREIYGVYWTKGLTPATAKTLVVLDLHFNTGERSGSGYDDGLCTISDDFSLVIRDVRLEDEGQYFCQVSDINTGELFWNQTIVTVFALPEEPFPTIKGCQGTANGQHCNMFSSSPINITCSVYGYFPSIDLYFYHKLERMKTLESKEWTGVDGTKSKSITTEAVTSSDEYTCVASCIPGSNEHGNRSAVVLVLSDENKDQASTDTPISSQTSTSAEWKYNSTFNLIIVLAIVLVIFCASFIVLRVIMRRDKKDSKYQSVETTELEVLDDSNAPVSKQEVQDFVRQLAGRHCRRIADAISMQEMDLPKPIEKVIEENMEAAFDTQKMLMDWLKEQTCSDNEMRSKLRDAAMSVRGKDLKDHDWICDDELMQVVKYLTPMMVPKFLEILHCENIHRETLPDILQEMRGWRDYGEPVSQKEKRRQLYNAVQGVYFSMSMLTDSELEIVCNGLETSDQCKTLKTGIGITQDTTSPDCNRSTLLHDLKTWRDSRSIAGWMFRNKLNAKLTHIGLPKLLAYRKGSHIYKADLVPLAIDLCIQDILPFTEALGIVKTKMMVYKRDFDHRNIHNGTFCLLTKLLDAFKFPFMAEKAPFFLALGKTGFIDCCRKRLLGTYHPSRVCTEIEKLDKTQIRDLEGLLKSRKDTDEKDMCRSTEEAHRWITDWFTRWIEEFESSYSQTLKVTLFPTTTTKDIQSVHRDFNDELLDSGFYDLAREVMAIEHQVTADVAMSMIGE